MGSISGLKTKILMRKINKKLFKKCFPHHAILKSDEEKKEVKNNPQILTARKASWLSIARKQTVKSV